MSNDGHIINGIQFQTIGVKGTKLRLYVYQVQEWLLIKASTPNSRFKFLFKIQYQKCMYQTYYLTFPSKNMKLKIQIERTKISLVQSNKLESIHGYQALKIHRLNTT